MKLSELTTDEERIVSGDDDAEITTLTADSREVIAGALFAALPGTEVDGARFIPGAMSAGAAAILAPEGADISQDCTLPIVTSVDPRRSLSRMAARLFAPQPAHVVAVTGTNGKTSVAGFVSQIWAALGHPAASIGTLGVVCQRGQGGEVYEVSAPDDVPPVTLTSPDPVTLHQALSGLARNGYAHVAVEASSHGLDQRRVDGALFEAGAFTNITRDHLDYHKTFEAYQAAKFRLFDTLLSAGDVAVINMDGPGHEAAFALAKQRELRIITHGRQAGDVRLTKVIPDAKGLQIAIEFAGKTYDQTLNLVGDFQAENALSALCLASATGVSIPDGIEVLHILRGAKGRLEPVGHSLSGGAIYVDFAHTPDALTTALHALRPHVSGRIITVFGAGGDRDPGKRPLMGEAVAAESDVAIVTDDNPRSEDPATIRSAVRQGCPSATEIGDRAEAIGAGIAMLKDGDALLVAGKGHETGQEIMGEKHPFSDHLVIGEALAKEAKT